jgi:hypothetical protein
MQHLGPDPAELVVELDALDHSAAERGAVVDDRDGTDPDRYVAKFEAQQRSGGKALGPVVADRRLPLSLPLAISKRCTISGLVISDSSA